MTGTERPGCLLCTEAIMATVMNVHIKALSTELPFQLTKKRRGEISVPNATF